VKDIESRPIDDRYRWIAREISAVAIGDCGDRLHAVLDSPRTKGPAKLCGPFGNASMANHAAVTHRIDGCVDVRVSARRPMR
jgi:hypothetical protein